MPEVTVSQYAEVIGIPVDRLIEQLNEAGINQKSAADVISDHEKSELLGFLRRKHGKDEAMEPRKITLKRKSISEIKVPLSTPGSRLKQRSKIVSVEYRKKRTYAKRGVIEAEEAKQKALEEERLALEEEAKKALELNISEVENTDTKIIDEPTAIEVETDETPPDEQTTIIASEVPVPDQTPEPEVEAAEGSKKQLSEQAKAKLTESGASKRSEKAILRKELHVASEKSGRRRKKPSRPPSVVNRPSHHAFEMPTAPVIREVDLPESITVADLAQRMSV